MPGNHDHQLLSPWLESRCRSGAAPLAWTSARAQKASTGTRAIARMVLPASLDVVYPGICSPTASTPPAAITSTPTSRSRARPPRRRRPGPPARRAGRPRDLPDDFEVALAPLYALLDALANAWARPRSARGQRLTPRVAATSADGKRDRGAPAWSPRVSRRHRRDEPGGHRAGERPHLSGAELRHAGLRAISDVVGAVGIGTRHVVFGHTHRSGPLPRRPGRLARRGRRAAVERRLLDLRVDYLGGQWGSPYWPGGAIELESGGDPGFTPSARRDRRRRPVRPPAAPLQA